MKPTTELTTDTGLLPLTAPVILIAYNRPRLTENVLSILRRVRPQRLLIVADGAKPGDDHDARAVDETRSLFDRIDWPCRVDRNFAPVNLGCSARVRTGLDWALNLVSEAIILEDDIDAVPQFFFWSQEMLKLYRNRDDVAMVCGHNALIRWPEVAPNSAAVPSGRGAISGWATWASSWFSVNASSVEGSIEAVDDDIAKMEFSPALAQLYRLYLQEARAGVPLSWDVDFTLRMAMSGRYSVVSPVNFIHHMGVGADATHHKDSDDTLFNLPRPTMPLPEKIAMLAETVPDQDFDESRVLLELLVRAKDPRLARLLAGKLDLPVSDAFRTHLLPFVEKTRSLHALEHLREEGLSLHRVKFWRSALTGDSEEDFAA